MFPARAHAGSLSRNLASTGLTHSSARASESQQTGHCTVTGHSQQSKGWTQASNPQKPFFDLCVTSFVFQHPTLKLKTPEITTGLSRSVIHGERLGVCNHRCHHRSPTAADGPKTKSWREKEGYPRLQIQHALDKFGPTSCSVFFLCFFANAFPKALKTHVQRC